ncbi:MAG: lipid-A-disaccharide synthase [Sedimentisphaerales bacterium]|nr:lipid-A-disaccharide synthase [Sedimentisphaerales bacterium]
MLDKDKKYRIFISAAEPSADAHCAGLITALKDSGYNIEFVGVGGPKMAEAGCELLESTVGRAVMIYKAFRHVGRYYKLVRRLSGYIRSNKIDLVIVCDSPAFNFHIAKAAKKTGVKTLFYVAPQLWAWASWRIYKLRKYCDKLCCILPFEQEWFGQRGMDVVFVGNPLFDELEINTEHHSRYINFEPEKTRFALMPGSRNTEIESLWKPMQQIAMRLKKKYPAASFVTVAVDNEREQLLKRTQIHGFECEYVTGSVNDTAGKVDFTIVTSGSATLEVTAAGCPMVIMYQSSRILWKLVGWWLIRSKYLSLVNILAGRELVPEFMPYFTSIEPIIESIEQLLQDREKLARMSSDLSRLAEPLSGKKARHEVAKIIAEML